MIDQTIKTNIPFKKIHYGYFEDSINKKSYRLDKYKEIRKILRAREFEIKINNEELRIFIKPISKLAKKSVLLETERLARSFRREFQYDFSPFCAESEIDVEKRAIFLFYDRHHSEYFEGNCSITAIGACSFIKEDRNWLLTWIWFHPYLRYKGIWKKSEPHFRKMFGDFEIEPPLSSRMQKYVLNHRPDLNEDGEKKE